MPISLTIDLRTPNGGFFGTDDGGVPGGALVTLKYDRDVRDADGTVPAPAQGSVVVSGATDPVVSVPFANDDAAVSDDSQGFAIIIGARWRQGTQVVSWSKTVAIDSSYGSAVNLSGLPTAAPVPPQYMTVSGALAAANQAVSDASAAESSAASSASAAAASAALVGAPAGTAIDAHLGGDSTTVVPDVTALKGQVVNLAAHIAPNTGADITAAVQAFANTLSDGDELLIGKGTWRIDGTLTFTQNNLTVRLRQGAVIDCSNAATATDSRLVFTGAPVTVKGRGSILSKASWDGTNTTWTNAVVKFTGDAATVRDITLTNVPKYGIGFFNPSGLCKVEGVTITGNYPSAQWTEVETGHFGIFFDPGITDSRINVKGCNVDSCVQGWCGGNYGAGSSVGSIVSGNTFTRCWNHGIYNSGGLTDMVVQGNTFRDCSRPIVMTDSGHNVSNNTLTASGTGSTLFWTAAIQMRNAIDCVVANNIIKGDVYLNSAAIDFSHVSGGTTISGNVISGNRIKLTTANQGYAIRVGTTASTIMANNTIQGNVVEGPGVTNFGVISLSASATATDSTGNVISGNNTTILSTSSGIFVTNLTRPKILSNIVKLGFDAASTVTLGGISLVGNTVSPSVRDNTITVPAAWGANINFRAIWEWASTVLASQISDNQITLDTTKLASGTPYVLAGGSPVLKASGVGVPAFVCGPGSQWLRTDGGAGSTLYVKESAANQSTWTAK